MPVSNAHQLPVKDWCEGETIDFAGLQIYTSSILQLWEFIEYPVFYDFFLGFFRLIWTKKAGEMQCVYIYNIIETKVSIQWRSNLAFLCSGIAFLPLHCPGFTNSENSP